MESNYDIKLTKCGLLHVNDSFGHVLTVEDSVEYPGATQYSVYNINCFYDHRNPIDFLKTLVEHVTQHVFDLTVEDGKVLDRYAIVYMNKDIAYFNVSKRRITIDSPYVAGDYTMSYASIINTLNVLKYIFEIMRVNYMYDKIRNFQHDNYILVDIHPYRTYVPYYGYSQNVNSKDKYTVQYHDKKQDIDFGATYDTLNKTLEFNTYYEPEGEHYSNGSEPLSLENIDQQIEYYNRLKYNADTIHEFLKTVEKTI
jgi:hypothetical protein